jgi:mono/diheme cytochrome c family protein
MRRRWKITLGVLMTPVLGLGVLAAGGQARWDRTFDVAEPALRASADPALIERGRYLAYGPAHCAMCHTTQDQWPRLEAGETVPMTGGSPTRLPFGTIHTPNLTPDAETGIGRWTDGQLARMLRYGVRPDGRAAVPFMETQDLSDEDIVALLSFLRSQQPVHNAVPPHELNALGRMVMAYLIRPKGPSAPPPAESPPEEATVARGRYVANTVAGCVGCHTDRSMLDGSFTGPRFAGGLKMPMDDDPTRMFVTPNLTPDSATGHIYQWTEERFSARFRAGRVHAGSHMPWAPYARMSDTDLRAIYRYLRSLDPVRNETGPLIQAMRSKKG